MDDKTSSDSKGNTEKVITSPHINSQECNCSDCMKQKQHYIQYGAIC